MATQRRGKRPEEQNPWFGLTGNASAGGTRLGAPTQAETEGRPSSGAVNGVPFYANAAPGSDDPMAGYPDRPDFRQIVDDAGNLNVKMTPAEGTAAQIAAPGKNQAATVAAPNKIAGNLQSVHFGDMKAAQAQGVGPIGYQGFGGGDAFGALKARATGTGQSPWLSAQLGKQALEQQGMTDDATRQAASATSAAQASLAAKGGVRSGTAARLAASGARGMNDARMAVARGGAMDRANLGVQDETIKSNLLGAAAGLESNMGIDASRGKLAADTTNAGNTLQTSLANAGFTQDARKTNALGNFDASRTNAGAHNAGVTQDVGNDLQVKLANAGFGQDMTKFDAGLGADVAKTNALMDTGVRQQNAGFAQQAGLANTGNTIAGLGAQSDDALKGWMTQMGAIGANKNANAIQNSGKK